MVRGWYAFKPKYEPTSLHYIFVYKDKFETLCGREGDASRVMEADRPRCLKCLAIQAKEANEVREDLEALHG